MKMVVVTKMITNLAHGPTKTNGLTWFTDQLIKPSMQTCVRKYASLIQYFSIRYCNMEVECSIDTLGYLVMWLFG